MIEEVKIPLNKTKLSILLMLAGLLVVASVWMLLDPGLFVSVRYKSQPYIWIVGVVSSVFFIGCAIIIIKKLMRTSYGLIINDEGITDHSTGVSLGLIKWADIVAIRTLHVQRRHKFILVEVRNPETYIASAKSRITKMAIKANYRLYGSPININPGSLKSNFPDLFETIEAAYHKYLQENQSID